MYACKTPQQTGQSGMFAVCYELSRRGWNVMPTTRNAAGIDIVIYSEDGGRKLGIQVKSLRDRKTPVPLGSNRKRIGDFWIIACGLGTGELDFYVMTPEEAGSRAFQDRNGKMWLNAKPSNPEQGYQRPQFLNAWDRIGYGNQHPMTIEVETP